MKNFLIAIILILTTLSTTTLHVLAVEADPNASYRNDGYTIIQYDDGSILTILPIEVQENEVSTYASANTKTASRRAYFEDASGNLEWEYTLTATFSYVNGVSSSCTNAYYTHNIYGSSWSFSDGSATASGNTAIGKGKFVEKFLLITIKTYNVDISITCDTYGNLT